MEPNEETVEYVMRLRPDWSHPPAPIVIPWDNLDPTVIDRIMSDWTELLSISCCCSCPTAEKVNWKQEGF